MGMAFVCSINTKIGSVIKNLLCIYLSSEEGSGKVELLVYVNVMLQINKYLACFLYNSTITSSKPFFVLILPLDSTISTRDPGDEHIKSNYYFQ